MGVISPDDFRSCRIEGLTGDSATVELTGATYHALNFNLPNCPPGDCGGARMEFRDMATGALVAAVDPGDHYERRDAFDRQAEPVAVELRVAAGHPLQVEQFVSTDTGRAFLDGVDSSVASVSSILQVSPTVMGGSSSPVVHFRINWRVYVDLASDAQRMEFGIDEAAVSSPHRGIAIGAYDSSNVLLSSSSVFTLGEIADAALADRPLLFGAFPIDAGASAIRIATDDFIPASGAVGVAMRRICAAYGQARGNARVCADGLSDGDVRCARGCAVDIPQGVDLTVLVDTTRYPLELTTSGPGEVTVTAAPGVASSHSGGPVTLSLGARAELVATAVSFASWGDLPCESADGPLCVLSLSGEDPLGGLAFEVVFLDPGVYVSGPGSVDAIKARIDQVFIPGGSQMALISFNGEARQADPLKWSQATFSVTLSGGGGGIGFNPANDSVDGVSMEAESLGVPAIGVPATGVPEGFGSCNLIAGLNYMCDLPFSPDRLRLPVIQVRLPTHLASTSLLTVGLDYGAAARSYRLCLRNVVEGSFPDPADCRAPDAGELSDGRIVVPRAHTGFRLLECDGGGGNCGPPLAEATLAATGPVYFKAPATGGFDGFAAALALSADAATLVVGARGESSSATGVFVPTDSGYDSALADNTVTGAGAVYVYRRSGAGLWALEAFIKAPVAGLTDIFGSILALSTDGATLAVGAPFEDSAATGVFAPSDPGYGSALASNQLLNSGAAYVYRRSTLTDTWAIEAFIKAPVAGFTDTFGDVLALSDDGDTLAVGVRIENSTYTGVFAPSDPDYGSALASEGDRSGATYVYRRSVSTWDIEAFIKAPNAVVGTGFGSAVALSANGNTLAVGAGSDDSTYTGVFAPSDPDYGSALDSDAGSRIGAAYVYRRSDADLWVIEAFIKAPRVNSEDIFGSAVALSANGSTLAVSAPNEDSSYTGVFAPSDPDYGRALDSNGTDASGAAYVYRRLDAGLWAFETFVKAPATGDDDFFGNALALSDDGSALAVSAHGEGSGYTGAFAPSDPDYGSALDSDGTDASGAVTVYRRSSTGQWMVKAFVKAPQTLRGDRLGCRAGTVAFALDRGRLVLAAGAPSEQSQAVGVFVPNPNDPGGPGAAYNAALVNGLPAGPGDRGCLTLLDLNQGAVYLY